MDQILIIEYSWNIIMTWSRLFHVKNIELAFKRVKPKEPLLQLVINKRYQAEIRKQYRLAGVPWIYNLKQQTPDQRDRKPKGTKQMKARELRHAKIQKNLLESDAKILAFRQERLNKRKLGGFDQKIAKGLPSWIKQDLNQVPQYMRKGQDDDEDDDD